MNNIALFSVPRSGSSWLGELLNSSPDVIYKFQPNFAYSFEFELKENYSKTDIDNFFLQLLNSNDDFVNGKLSISGTKRDFSFEKISHPSTLLFKETHYLNVIKNLIDKSETKVIGLVRSPFAVINSWLKIPKEFNPEWCVEDEWRRADKKNQNKPTHYFGYHKWKEACFQFLELRKIYPEQFYLINYDDLLLNTEQVTRDIFKFCELKFTDQTIDFILKSTSSQSKDAYSVFKQKSDDLAWKNSLPLFIEDRIKDDEEFKFLNSVFQWI